MISQSSKEKLLFLKVLPEITVNDSPWRYFSKWSGKRDTDRDFFEALLKNEASHDQTCARQLRQQELDVKDRPMSMETILNRLEDNQKLIERLDIESPAKSKAAAVNRTEKQKQLHANPAYTTTTKVFSLRTGT